MEKLLPYIASILGLLTFFKAIWEYTKAQKWKKLEFIANQMKEFNNDVEVKKAMQMLDYTNREIELYGVKVVITNELLESALCPDLEGKNKNGFTLQEAQIRDIFDHFFEKLSIINQYISSGLITVEDVKPYLIYWINILGKDDNIRKPKALIHSIWKYWQSFNYTDMILLLERFGYNATTI
jgi:hypothetical protein